MATMPSIGGHYGIERQLLMAGKKPVGWLFLYSDEQIAKEPESRKLDSDRAILDQAVRSGQLKSMDITNIYGSKIRLYCQPGFEEHMKAAACDEMGLERTEGLPKESLGHLLGYRYRDVIFYELYNHLPRSLKPRILNMNEPFKQAFQERTLDSLGLDTPS